MINQNTNAKDQVRNMLCELAVVHVTQDVDALERMCAHNFVYFNCHGKAMDKAECLSGLMSNELTYEEWDSDEVSIQLFGDTAISTSIETVKGYYSGQDISGQYRLTLVFVKHQGEWQIVLGHETEIK